MSEDINESIHNLKLNHGLLEKDVQSLNKFCDKISESIQKIQELNHNFMKMISLCEQRHIRHDDIEETLKEDLKEVHSRITSVNRDMHDRLLSIEHSIGKKIDDLKVDLQTNYCKNEDAGTFLSFIRTFDKYKWMVVGAALVIGWILGHLNLEVLGSLLVK